MANPKAQVISVTIDAAAIAAKLGPGLYLGAVRLLLTEASLLAERTARRGAPRDTGALARSITSQVQPLSARVGTSLSYARPVEYGRRPGSMPPPQALVGWAGRHRFDGSVWALARAVQRRGIKGRFFLRGAAQATEKALPAITRRAASRIEAAWKAR